MLLVYFNAKIKCRAWAINKKNHQKYLGLWPLGPGFSLTKAFRIVWPGLLRELDDDEVTKWGSTNVVSDEFEVARDELFCSERSCSWFELTSMPLDKQPPKNGCVLFKSTTYTDTFDILYATPIYKKVLFWVVRNLTIAMSYITHEWTVNYTWNLPFEWLQLPNLEFCPSPLKYGHIYQWKAPSDEFWASHGIQRIEHFLLDGNLGTYKDKNVKFRDFIWLALKIFICPELWISHKFEFT